MSTDIEQRLRDTYAATETIFDDYPESATLRLSALAHNGTPARRLRWILPATAGTALVVALSIVAYVPNRHSGHEARPVTASSSQPSPSPGFAMRRCPKTTVAARKQIYGLLRDGGPSTIAVRVGDIFELRYSAVGNSTVITASGGGRLCYFPGNPFVNYGGVAAITVQALSPGRVTVSIVRRPDAPQSLRPERVSTTFIIT